MAVTDLTDSLPWWARGGGPTGGPGAAPQGSGVGGQPPPGMNQQAWLQYLMQMFNPISSASAAEVPPDDHGDGNNPPVSPDPRLGSSVTANPSPITAAQTQPPAPGGPSILPQARGAANPPFPPAPPAAGPSILPQARGVAVQPGPMAPGSTTMAAPGPAAAAAPAAPVPGPLATGGATAMGASSNPRFVQLDQGQNIDPTGRNRGPQMTALNLAGLFGGGGAPAAGGAQNVPLNQTPMPPPRPRVPGPLASAPLPPTMPDDIRRRRAIQLAAARSGFA
jgi:hypothetical protein